MENSEALNNKPKSLSKRVVQFISYQLFLEICKKSKNDVSRPSFQGNDAI